MATINAEIRGAVGIARLNRPEVRNALSPELMTELVDLVERWDADEAGRARLTAAIAHALRFETWQSLARTEGLGNKGAADLMVALARCAGELRVPGRKAG